MLNHKQNSTINIVSSNKILVSNNTNSLSVTNIMLIILGAFSMAAFSQIGIPMFPVPITGQTLGLLLIGSSLGARNGFLSVLTYVILGIIGAPFFASSSSSLLSIMSASGGYIVGFAFTSLIMGKLINKYSYQSFIKFFVNASIALIPTFALGLIWLGVCFGFNSNIFKFGLYPFLIGETIKIVIAYLLINAGSSLSRLLK